MPSSLHPQAKFDPIPPDLDLSALTEKTSNFDYVIRISADQITDRGLDEFEKLVLLHVIVGGKPLVVENWNARLPSWLFSRSWLQENVGMKQENVRDIGNKSDIRMTIGHYLRAMGKLTEQWTPSNFRDTRRQRLYLKDIDCPEGWYQHLQNIMPQMLFYLNDCMGEKGGPGFLHERNTYNQLVPGKGIGPAGDLMSSLPPPMRAENMMCYIGHEGTYTPAHREMCATLGQNIMVEASDYLEGDKPGSSIWFMTESKDREVVSEYFLSMLGHDIEVESHFAQINAWKKAPFPVYIVEQKVGDLILIPPLAPHQVWNRGTRTMKVAWNRTTVETLELALSEALPRARMVCRDEQYKCKAIVYYTLIKYYDLLKRLEQADGGMQHFANEPIRNVSRIRQLQKDFKRLFQLYTQVLISETFSSELPKEKNVEYLPYDSNVTCSYCRCNIFNRFLTCKTCISTIEDTNEEDTYDVCMECYAMGRSCGCISNLKWVEQWHWSVLTFHYDEWRSMIIAMDGFIDLESSPPPLNVAMERYGRKPVAEICQEQLRIRPWRDISKPTAIDPLPGDSDNEPEVDDEGRLKKKKLSRSQRRKSQQNKNGLSSCHVCKHDEWNWKLAFCTTCSKAYCYGSLWRAFDFKPQTIMEDRNWQCPKCLNICSCGACRKDPSQHPYQPKGTLLGHDTRRIADPRSVESLVDFGRTNLSWLRGDDDPQSSLRMQKLMQKAQADKARVEALEEDEGNSNGVVGSSPPMAIDPLLRGDYPVEANFGRNKFLPINMDPHTSMQSTIPRAAHQTNPPYPNFRDYNLVSTTHSNSHVDNPYARVNGGFVAPPAAMDSTYPDPSGLGRDKMVGMGYYQQASEVDKILFDHPDFNTPTGQTSSFMLSNLAQKREEQQPTRKRRKTDPHEAMIAQASEALAEARKRGFYSTTPNKISRGTSLIVKLRLTNSKAFLRQLNKPSKSSEDLVLIRSDVQDKASGNEYHENNVGGQDSLKHVKPTKSNRLGLIPDVNAGDKSSPLGDVPAHGGLQTRKAGPVTDIEISHSNGPSKETPVLTRKGKRGKGRSSKRRSDESPAMAISTDEVEVDHRKDCLQTFKPTTKFLEPQKHQSVSPLQKITILDGANSEDETISQVEVKKTVKRKYVIESNIRNAFQEDDEEDVIKGSNIASKKPRRKGILYHPDIDGGGNVTRVDGMTPKNSALGKRKATSLPKDFIPDRSKIQHKRTAGPRKSARLSAVSIDDPATPTPSSIIGEDLNDGYYSLTGSDSFSNDEELAIIDKDVDPIHTSTSISREYEMAKLESLRMVEGGLEEPEKIPVLSISNNSSPIMAGERQPTIPAKAPLNTTKSLPKAPKGKFMSMAERRASQKKPFKIVSAKPSSATGSIPSLRKSRSFSAQTR